MYSWILVFAVVFGSEALCDPIHKRKLMENPNLYEGDIVLPQNRYGRNAVAYDVELWPNGTVPFKFDKPRSNKKLWRPIFIIKAMKAIERAVDGCVRFVPHTTETDYVVITESIDLRCQSSLGRLGGEQKIQLHFICLDIGTVIHELMHVLGFAHEHMRSDRDEYLRINFENIQEDSKDQFIKFKEWDNRLCGPFDYDSIMIYSNKAYLKPGTDGLTITGRHGYIPLKYAYQKKGLTKLDVIKLKRLYRCGEEKPCDPPAPLPIPLPKPHSPENVTSP